MRNGVYLALGSSSRYMFNKEIMLPDFLIICTTKLINLTRIKQDFENIFSA